MTTLSHPAIAESLPTETLLGWLRDMYLIREFEIRTMQAYQNKKIGGFCHVYIGQEAVAVGCVAATRNNDPLVTAYRDHGHGLARRYGPQVRHGRNVWQAGWMCQRQGRLHALL